MNTLLPGPDGHPLPRDTLVFRVGKNAQLSPTALGKRKASPAMFELSSEDKASAGQRLSIWVEALTVADQAWDFMGAKPDRTVVACLSVDDIRAIVPLAGFNALEVEWEQAMVADGQGGWIPNTRPGAEGHAGVAGLNQGGGGKAHSNARKALRSALADVASISPVPVPHDIPEEHIQVAAYHIHLNQGAASPEGDWIAALRHLRRSEVQRRRAQPT